MNETTGDSLALENESMPYKGTNNFDNVSDTQSPLLPRSGWQNRRAFLSVLIKTKRTLDIAEMTAFLD